MVIVIVQELEFDEVELAEAPTSIGGGLSLLAGSAAPCEKAPPKNRKTATTAAKHRKRSVFIADTIFSQNMLNKNILAQHILYNLPHAAKCGRISCPASETPSETACNTGGLGSKVTDIGL